MNALPAIGTPEDDQVAEYLKSNNMLRLLQVQLEERVVHADAEQREQLVAELSTVYLKVLRATSPQDPYYELIQNQAKSLVKRMGSAKMYELRIELLIQQYLAIESHVELAKLELLDEDLKATTAEEMKAINSQLSTLTKQLEVDVAKKERARSRSNQSNVHQEQVEYQNLLRYRSLAHYYHGWSGYSVAFLKNQHVPNDAYISFGWLLGAKGDMPQYSLLNESTLEFDHVARAAIGLALAYAQSENHSLARSWAKNIAHSTYSTLEIKQAAQSQLIQIMAMDHAWPDITRMLIDLGKSDDAYKLSVKDARFVSLQSLRAMQDKGSRRGDLLDAKKTAKAAIGALVAHGEIGHVLELYRRFDSLPVLSNSFITIYAQALADLNEVEAVGDSALYSSVALRFEQAMASSDANLFPFERDDCALKLAYCELKSGRVNEAIQVCEELIERTTLDGTVEEARWLRVASLAALAKKSTRDQTNLDIAVREYIVAYPATSKSAKLILRHAMHGAVDSATAIETLEQVSDDDPIAVPARRALVGIFYEHSKSIGYTDQSELDQIIELVRWITVHETTELDNAESNTVKLGIIRIGLDITLRSDTPDTEFATKLVRQGTACIDEDSSLQVFTSEFVYRQIQIALLENHMDQALESLESLNRQSSQVLQNAKKLILNHLMIQWRNQRKSTTANLIIQLGSEVIADSSPPYPEPVNLKISRMIEVVIQAGHFSWLQQQSQANLDLISRLSRLVLERGKPSKPGLEITTAIASLTGEQELELEAWLLIFSACNAADEEWFQARFETLRLMALLDLSRAKTVYTQYILLHPNGGKEPWASKIAQLAKKYWPNDSLGTDGEQP